MNEDIKCCKDEIKDYKSAFECFKQRFLIEKKSIFSCDNDEIILTEDNITYLIENFVNNGYSGDASFIEKIKHQLVDSPNNKHLNGALAVLATAVWLWRLPPFNSTKQGRISSVTEILSLRNDQNKIDLSNNHFFGDYKGFASTGTYYNTNKPTELAYIIKFFQKYLEADSLSTEIEILTSDTFSGKMSIQTTKDYSYENKKDKQNPKINKQPDTSHDKARTVSIHNALLYLFKPDDYEPILSNDHKEKIKKVFSQIFDLEEENIDNAIKVIKNILQSKISGLKAPFFYEATIKNIWMGGLDFESKNIILHGAPGTGKTYTTEETIKARKLIENNSEYELVQFHPSYGYEDFIEGIKPTGLHKGQMTFELKNGVFKQLCIDAFKELVKAKDDKQYKAKTYYFIADEINRAELSRVFGELLLCIEDDKRLRYDEKGQLQGTKVKTPNLALWEDKHAVVIEGENRFFGVPENIYFIGTMNDIDRSVDSFDMALRRRFVWKHYRCDYDVIVEKFKDESSIEKYTKICEKLNDHITSEKGFNLSDSYELGQSYFMKPKKLIQKEIDRVWSENIAPILKEYLRAEYDSKDIEKHLQIAKDLFKI